MDQHLWSPSRATVGLGLLIVPPSDFTGAAWVGAIVGALTALSATKEGTLHQRAMRFVAVRVLLASAGAGTLVALGVLLGGLIGPCLIVFGLTSPPAVRRVAGWLFQLPPRSMSDHQLCSAWRSSTLDLPHAPPHQRLPLIQQRQRYLDEMELRNGPGFQDWLDSGGGMDAALECFMVRDSKPAR